MLKLQRYSSLRITILNTKAKSQSSKERVERTKAYGYHRRKENNGGRHDR
jgi:hypothetical protein